MTPFFYSESTCEKPIEKEKILIKRSVFEKIECTHFGYELQQGGSLMCVRT